MMISTLKSNAYNHLYVANMHINTMPQSLKFSNKSQTYIDINNSSYILTMDTAPFPRTERHLPVTQQVLNRQNISNRKTALLDNSFGDVATLGH